MEYGPMGMPMLGDKPTTYRRGNGSGFLMLGYAVIALGVLLFVLALNAASQDGWAVMLVSSGLLSLGLILLAVGSIIRALWFLPGEEEKQVAVKQPV